MSVWVLKVPCSHNLDEVRQALSILADPEYAIQLQAAPHFAFATFRSVDIEAAVSWVAGQGSARGVYFALNPVKPDLTDRVKNGDPVSRRWLLVDIDRNKPEDSKELSATDAEHERARSLTLDVKEYLTSMGWPEPLLIDSGNGFHLLYRVDLPNTKHSKSLLRKALHKLAGKFNGDRGAIGKECHDARRISKLPGTWARRGAPSSERPHRLCRMVYAPTEIHVVTPEMLGAVGEGEPEANGHSPNPFTLRAMSASSEAYGKAALDQECGKVALAPAGQRNDTLNKAAFSLGRLIGGKVLERGFVEQCLYQVACRCGLHEDPGCGESGIRGTIASGIDAGILDPRGVPDRNGSAAHGATCEPFRADQPRKRLPPERRPRIYRLPELLATEFPPPNWAIPGILSEGMTFLAGKPKLGKSWLALNLSLTIAVGGMALGTTKVLPGDVLYLSLEDRWRRVKDRAGLVLKGLSIEASSRLHVAVEWPKQDMGGLVELAEWLESVHRPSLVIIDTWARFRPSSKSGRSAYDQDYEQVAQLKGLIDHYGTSALLVHHCKKAAAEDVVDELSGTLGLAGASDGTLVLTRARTENEAELFITGRDVEEQQLALEFDPKGFTWKSLGPAEHRSESKYKSALIAVFKANAGAVMALSDLAAQIECPKEKHGYLRTVLYRMTNCDQPLIERVGSGRYRWPVSDGTPF